MALSVERPEDDEGFGWPVVDCTEIAAFPRNGVRVNLKGLPNGSAAHVLELDMNEVVLAFGFAPQTLRVW
jgi:hypothetical protein